MTSSAVVCIAALDLRRRPNHRSELRSQLLMGERVRVLSWARHRKWARVENLADRYRGWVRAWGLEALAEAEADAWEEAARWRVACRHLELRSGKGKGAIVGPLFWNSPVILAKVERSYAQVVLPDGMKGWTERRNLRARERKAGTLEQVIEGFHGIPYLWGGRTPLGFDCSGFVQQTLAAVGVSVPRDAHEQFVACRPVPRSRSPRRGDLLFFGRPGKRMTHVGIALGRGLYAHARGRVRLNSLLNGNALYDKDMTDTFRSVGRP